VGAKIFNFNFPIFRNDELSTNFILKKLVKKIGSEMHAGFRIQSPDSWHAFCKYFCLQGHATKDMNI
jgi:hypothetical protein